MILHYLIPGLCILIAGIMQGIFQSMVLHTDNFIEKLKLNKELWDYRISYLRKYKNRDPLQGQTFRGKYLTFTVDPLHFIQFIFHLFIFTATAICISIPSLNNWWEYAIAGLSLWGVNRIGFNVIWKIF